MVTPNPPQKTSTQRVTWISFALFALALAACGGDREEAARPRAADAEVVRGGTAVLAEAADMSKPMPLLVDSELDGRLEDILYMSLLRAAWEDGELVYRTSNDSPMAMAWLYKFTGPDSTALRFRMRSALRWSDGEPITADDVVFTYRMLADPEVASPRQNWTEHLDSVVAENDSTVVFHFDRRYPEMLFHASHAIVPEHVYAGIPPGELRTSPPLTDPAKNLVVSGPFKIGSWEQGQSITLVSNPYGPVQPRLDAIVLRVIPEPTTRLVELRTGGVDFVRPVAHDQFAELRRQMPGVRVEREAKRFYDYIAYNPDEFAPFTDPEIRRALGLAIDVPGILRALQMEDFAVPAAGPYSPVFQELQDAERVSPLPYDTARARQILASKGWRDSDGDGVLDKNGTPFRFTLLTNSGNQRRADVSQIIQQQWKQIGVDARLRQQEWNTLYERLTEGDYQAMLAGWQVGLSPDISAFWDADAPQNVVGYENAEVSALMDQALAQPTEAAANPLWREAAARVVADQPYTWLYYLDQVSAASPRLRGMKVDTYGAFQNAWEWWIPRDRQRLGGAADTSAATPSP